MTDEIVRCKDCIHRPWVDESKRKLWGSIIALTFPDDECPCQCGDCYYSWMPDDDWFCGNGEANKTEGGRR